MSNKGIDEEVEHCRQQLRHCPRWSKDRLPLISELSKALFNRYQQLGGIEYLEESITYCREGIKLCPRWNPHRPRSLNNLGAAMCTRFEQLGSMEDLEEAVTCHREALALCPHGHPDHSASLNNLATAVYFRYKQLGRMEDLEEAITSYRKVLALHLHGHPNHSASLSNLGAALSARFRQLGRMEDLEEAITCDRDVLALHPYGHPDRSGSLSNLGAILFLRFKHLGRMEDLEEAIISLREALALRPHGHPSRSDSLSNLANAIFSRFEKLGKMEDLEEAIMSLREALAFCPDGHTFRSSSLTSLASALCTRFKQLGGMEDLDEAITCHREALALHPHGHPGRFISLNSLANAMCTRFQQLGRMEDLEEAITSLREALALCPRGHHDHATSLSALGAAVSIRFEQLGRMEDLEEAIKFHREALGLHHHGHPHRSSSLSNYGTIMFVCFEQLGSIEDLEEAITSLREALALRPHGHPDRSGSLTNLANAVSIRFEHFGRMEDLDEAITCHREALTLCPHGHPSRSDSLSNFANVMCTRFEQLERMEDLEEAISSRREALALCPHGHPHRSASLSSLAITLSTRFEHLRRMEDLEDALKYLSEAKSILPPEHPGHATAGPSLARMLLLHSDIIPKSEESLSMTSKAFALFKDAANHSFATVKARFKATVQWAQAAHRYKHESTVEAYTRSLILLDRCLVLAPTVESQQNFLAVTNTVPRALALDAASGAIDAGELASAVELLEQGRAVLWSKLRGYRHPLDKLCGIDEKLADQFKALSSQLECLATSSESQSTAFVEFKGAKPIAVAFEAKMQHHRVLSKDWDDVVRTIRQVDGFADFLQAVPFATLQKAAAEGPVVIVNISRYRSDAIILRAVGDPVLVPLPETSPDVLNQLSFQLTKARASDGPDSARQILPILRSLWNSIAFPVREQLIALGVPDKSRIWWCPTSDLCALPLHAAGAYSKIANLKPDNLPDCYTSSYTPTLSALISARSGVISGSTDPNLLLIAQPDDTLPEVENEISRIQQLTHNVDVLKGPEANHDTVLSSLRMHSWAHFACHGHLDNQPFHSYFQLHNSNHLAVVDLIRAQLPDAELAFLSACHTAMGDLVGTPDEAIHLAAAMQFCGFRSVVGTLWAMEDVDGCDVAEHFYRHMFRSSGARPNFRDSAEALHLAIRELRRRKLGLDRWVKFVHIGA